MEVVTTAELAKLLRISAQRVRQLADARGIAPAMIVGTARIITTPPRL
jgi:plasmid maintenance system antidote protein VapI